MKNSDSNIYNNLDVLFISPPLWRFMGKSWDNFPLGLGYLVSSLNSLGIKSKIFNADICDVIEYNDDYYEYYFSKRWEQYYFEVNNNNNPIWSDVKEVLALTNPKIVGISSKAVDIPSTLNLARIIKDFNCNIPVIIGGASASTYSDILIENEKVDFLVQGEGEETIKELIPLLLTGGDKSVLLLKTAGILFKKDNHVIKSDKRNLITDIDKIPFPDRDSVFSYKNKKIVPVRSYSDILVSRGCPYKCKFCCNHVVWGTYKPRIRSVENVIEELYELKTKYNQKFFIFWDDLFTINRNSTIHLCNLIIEKKMHIKWICLVRLDTIDQELLKIMKDAGCVEIQIGVESGNDRILSLIGKKITLRQIFEKMEIVRKSDLRHLIFLMIGFPSETESEIHETIDLICKLRPTSVDLSVFSPYPGTPFYDELKERGVITDLTMRSDPSNLNNNYSGTLSDDEFQMIAEYGFKFVDNYNKSHTCNPYFMKIRIQIRAYKQFLFRSIFPIFKALKI